MEIMNDFFSEVKNLFFKYKNYIYLFLVLVLFFSSSIFVLIPIKIFGLNINDIGANGKALLNLFPSFVMIAIIILLYYKDLIRDFKALKKDTVEKFDTAFRYWVIGLAIMIASNFIIQKLGIGIATNEVEVKNFLKTSPFIYGISVCLTGPFIEEIVFRKTFKDAIKNKWLYILLSGIIFGSLHVITSLSSVLDLLYLIPYCSLGIAFGFICYDTDNIWPSIFIHILHNSGTAFINFLLAGVIL